MVGYPLIVLSQKLKNLKIKLKEWNKGVLGEVNENISKALRKIE